MEYVANTGVILYWKPYQTYFIHRANSDWLVEYNYHISTEYKYPPGYLIFQQDT